MAGLGRRTHYRKHLTDSVLYDLPEPKEDERIAKVTATRGGNQFDIILADSKPSSTEISSRSGLAILPTKFHKLVWVKRNDYVIVQTGSENKSPNNQNDEGENREDEGSKGDPLPDNTNSDPHTTGIRFIITHILYKDQIKHLVSKGLWPKNDPIFLDDGNSTSESATGASDSVGVDNDAGGDITYTESTDDGIVYTEYDIENDDDLFVNTNRIARLEIQDSDEEDSSDEED